jgi:hypothetical protein
LNSRQLRAVPRKQVSLVFHGNDQTFLFPAHLMAGPTIDLILSGKWDSESLAKKQAALRVRISEAATGISSFPLLFI